MARVRANGTLFSRDECVSLRREYFGGIAFHRANGTTIELDRSGAYLLQLLGTARTIDGLEIELSSVFKGRSRATKIKGFLDELISIGFVKNVPIAASHPPDGNAREKWREAHGNSLCAPETVHLMITDRCNLECPCCYVKNRAGRDMSTDAIFALIDRLAEMRVFQLAIGGGEPFLREDIYEILDYCNQNSIVPNITSNGTLIDADVAAKIKTRIGQINISLNGHSSKTNIGRDGSSFSPAIRGLRLLLAHGVPVGVNVLVTKEGVAHLHGTLRFLDREGVRRVNLLRPKPFPDREQFARFKLSTEDLVGLKRVLDAWNGMLHLTVDSSLTCLMRHVSAPELRANAVYGCVGGTRFCTVENNGDVYPCSFLRGNEFLAGNIMSDDFQEIWSNAGIFKRLRGMRSKLKGKCRACRIKRHCGGCRSIALHHTGDMYGAEGFCVGGL